MHFNEIFLKKAWGVRSRVLEGEEFIVIVEPS